MAASTNETKNIFTTHEVSKLLQVNPRSVINWIEQDLLDSYRTPEGIGASAETIYLLSFESTRYPSRPRLPKKNSRC